MSQSSATRALLLLTAFALLLTCGTSLWLTNSPTFWRYCLRQAPVSDPTYALKMEAALRLAQPGNVKVVLLGSSLALTNVHRRDLADGLGLQPHEVMLAGMPAGTAVEMAMFAPLIGRLRPRVVLLPVSEITLLDVLGEKEWRFYRADIAAEIYGPMDLLRQHDHHFSGLLMQTHPVIRHRDALRRTVFPAAFVEEGNSRRRGRHQQQEGPGGEDPLMKVAQAEMNCDNANIRAFAVLASHLREQGATLVLAASPIVLDLADRQRRTRFVQCLRASAAAGGYQVIALDGLDLRLRHFRDAMHFNQQGRRVFTAHLIPPLTQLLATPAP